MAPEHLRFDSRKIKRTPAILGVMREAYERREKLSVVAAIGDSTPSAVAKYAKRHGWHRSPRRYGQPRPLLPPPENIGLLRGRWALRLHGMKEAIRRAAELP